MCARQGKWDANSLLANPEDTIESELARFGSFQNFLRKSPAGAVKLLTWIPYDKISVVANRTWKDYPSHQYRVPDYDEVMLNLQISGAQNQLEFRASHPSEAKYIRHFKRDLYRRLCESLCERPVTLYHGPRNGISIESDEDLIRVLSALPVGMFHSEMDLKRVRGGDSLVNSELYRAVYAYASRLNSFDDLAEFERIFFQYIGIEFEEWVPDFWADNTLFLANVADMSYAEYRDKSFCRRTLVRIKAIKLRLRPAPAPAPAPMFASVQAQQNGLRLPTNRENQRRVRPVYLDRLPDSAKDDPSGFLGSILLDNPNIELMVDFLNEEAIRALVDTIRFLRISSPEHLDHYPSIKNFIRDYGIQTDIEAIYPGLIDDHQGPSEDESDPEEGLNKSS